MASTALRQLDDPVPFRGQAPACPQPVRLVARQGRDFSDPFRIAQWEQLAREAAEPNPFFEHWFLLPALDALDPAGSVQLLCLEEGSRLLGLIPMRREARYYGRPIPHWRGWVHPNCFLGTPLVVRSHAEAFWRALLNWTDNAGQGLFLHLPELPDDGPLFHALAKVAREDQRGAGVVRSYARAVLRRGMGSQDYYETTFSRKRRQELERRFRRLADLGEVAIERQRDPQGIGEWIEDFLATERSGWKGQTGSALACDAATSALFREATTAAAARGQLERLTIRLDGRPIAFLSTLLTASGAFGLKTTYDERFARFSPGAILQRHFLDILDRPDFAWCDSCTAPDHPVIEHFWSERRTIASVNLGIGGRMRRALFRCLLMAEKGQPLRSRA